VNSFTYILNMNKKIVIDPDWTLEWLIDCGFVEKTDNSFRPYRIATNPMTDRPYTLHLMESRLRRHTGTSNKSTHSKPYERELKKCFNEYNISYFSLTDHAVMMSHLRPNRLLELESELNISLDTLTKDERRKVSILFSKNIKSVGREEALKRMYLYINRRLQNPGKDLRNGKVVKYEPISDVPMFHHSDQTSSFQLEDMLPVTGLLRPFSYHNRDDDDHDCQRYDECFN